ncbi:MAG TPA: hypothetical protein PL193_10460 [Xanthobacteraceae bacterium]|nr:hypothetical protein [Xanthobacteraceae bacterium]
MRDQEFVQATTKFFSRYLIALCFAFKHRGDGPSAPERFQAASGFLLSVRGRILFATAGHILKNWNQAFDHPEMEIRQSWLCASLKSGLPETPQLPFDYRHHKQILWFDRDRGLDYGAIQLSDQQVSQLMAKDVVVVEGEKLPSVNVGFEHHLILGLPINATKWDMERATVSPKIMEVMRVPPPFDRIKVEFTEFVGFVGGEVIEGGPNDMSGMSGGIVFGVSKGGDQLMYSPFAIQSWCRGDEGLAFSCPIRNFAEHIAAEIDRAKI